MSLLRVLFMMKGIFMGLAQLCLDESKPTYDAEMKILHGKPSYGDYLQIAHALIAYISFVLSIGHMYFEPGHKDNNFRFCVLSKWKVVSTVFHVLFQVVFWDRCNVFTAVFGYLFFSIIACSFAVMIYYPELTAPKRMI